MAYFDDLLDELSDDLGLAKAHRALDTSEDDRRISQAASDGDDDEVDFHPTDIAMLKLIRKLSNALSVLGREVKEIRAAIGAGSAAGQSMSKALRLASGSITGEEFMAKAMSAQAAGRITGLQVATAEACINAKQAPPQDIVAAVLE